MYRARNLDDIAKTFSAYAKMQEDAAELKVTKKAKCECMVRARTWHEAAEMLRQTEFSDGTELQVPRP